MRITRAIAPPDQESGRMSIIIQRSYAHLQLELHRVFEGQKDVKVIVDRRYGERRTRQQSVAVKRRRADRRRSKEQLIEVVISV